MIKQNFIKFSKLFSLIVLMAFVSCKQDDKKSENSNKMGTNVFLEEWSGPYEGVPAFDKMKIEDLKVAVKEGMKLNLKEIDAIVENTEAPTFENTIVAMERSGSVLDRVFAYYGIIRIQF